MIQQFNIRLAFYILIIVLQLMQIFQVEGKSFWHPHFDNLPPVQPTPATNQIDSFMKMRQSLLSTINSEISLAEFVELLKYLKKSIDVKRARYPEYWLLREGR